MTTDFEEKDKWLAYILVGYSSSNGALTNGRKKAIIGVRGFCSTRFGTRVDVAQLRGRIRDITRSCSSSRKDAGGPDVVVVTRKIRR